MPTILPLSPSKMLVPGMSHPPSMKNQLGLGGSIVTTSDVSGSSAAVVSAGAAWTVTAVHRAKPMAVAAKNPLTAALDIWRDPP